MKVLKLVLNDSMDIIELFLDGNRLTLKVSTDNRLSAKQATSVTLDHDETCELMDFLEQLEDEMSVNDFIDESPSELTEDQYHAILTQKPKFIEFLEDDIEFPTSDDIQAWLSNQDDNSEENED